MTLSSGKSYAARFLPALLLLLMVYPAGTMPARAQVFGHELDVSARVHGLSVIWREAAYNFPYFDQLPGLDWDEEYRNFVPRVIEAESTFEYYRLLQRFMALLEDGHSRVELPDTILQRHPFSSPWVELRSIGGAPMVANVASSLVDSLPIGSEIIAVDGTPVDSYLTSHVLPLLFASAPHSRRISAIEGSHTRGYGLLVGPPGSTVTIDARTPSGSRVRLSLVRDRFTGQREWSRPAETGRRAVLEVERFEGRIVRLAVNSFADATLVARVDSLMSELCDAAGVIIDLRQNGGGNDVIAADLLARFTDRPLIGTASRVRVHNAYYRALGSFGRPVLERALPPDSTDLVERAIRHFTGKAWELSPPDTVLPAFDGERVAVPVAVLIGRGTGSAAENFVVRIPDGERFFTVGSPTAGSTGQPLRFELPGGGLGQVVTRGVLLPDGTPIVRTGIAPDFPVEPTIGDVLNGHDPVLDMAVRLLRERR